MQKPLRNFIKNKSLGIIGLSTINLPVFANSLVTKKINKVNRAAPWFEISKKVYLKSVKAITCY